jgi:hypothetical protein
MSEENVSLPVAQALASALTKIEAYVPTEYVDNSEPDLDAEHLNHAEQGIMRVTNLLNAAVDVIQGQESRLAGAETKIGTDALTGGMTDLSSGLNAVNSDLNAVMTSSISIPSGSPVTGNRTDAKIYQNKFLILTGEVSIDFTNLKNWNGYDILRCSNGSKYPVNFIATDENGGSFHMQIQTNGIIRLSTRGYIPENKSQILRFFCIAPIGT